MKTTAKRKRSRTGAGGSTGGQALVESARQLADALERGDYSTLTVRKIEVTDPSFVKNRVMAATSK